MRKWYLIGGEAGSIPTPPPPVGDYYPKLDFTDYRNSMYSIGGF
jgi:hypothetical protein